MSTKIFYIIYIARSRVILKYKEKADLRPFFDTGYSQSAFESFSREFASDFVLSVKFSREVIRIRGASSAAIIFCETFGAVRFIQNA